MNRNYLVEDAVISVLREFSSLGYFEFSTGFQRYYAQDLINMILNYNNNELLEVIKNKGFIEKED